VWADVVLFGTPTRFGNPASQLRAFLETTGPLWFQGKLADKVYSSPIPRASAAFSVFGANDQPAPTSRSSAARSRTVTCQPARWSPIADAGPGDDRGPHRFFVKSLAIQS
jgi:hypothetical protein